MRQVKVDKNVPNWQPTERDYVLVFIPDEDYIWRERSNNVPKYFNITLAEYLQLVNIVIPDYCQFLRVVSDDMYFEYRAYNDARVRIDVTYKD